MKYLKYFKKEKLMAGLACLDFIEAGPLARGTVRNAGSSSRKRKPCGRSRGVDVVTKLFYVSGQIIATSHDLTPKGSSGRKIPKNFREI